MLMKPPQDKSKNKKESVVTLCNYFHWRRRRKSDTSDLRWGDDRGYGKTSSVDLIAPQTSSFAPIYCGCRWASSPQRKNVLRICWNDRCCYFWGENNLNLFVYWFYKNTCKYCRSKTGTCSVFQMNGEALCMDKETSWWYEQSTIIKYS